MDISLGSFEASQGLSAECPHYGAVAAVAHHEQTQNKTAAPGAIRRGGDSSAIEHGKPKAKKIYTAAPTKPRDASDVRRLRTLLLHAINEDHELTPHSRIVGVFLCGLVNVHSEQAWPSAEHISERLGISKRTVYRAIQQLEGRYFTVVRSKHTGAPGEASTSERRSNTYRPIWPPEHLAPERLSELRSRMRTAEAADAEASGQLTLPAVYELQFDEKQQLSEASNNVVIGTKPSSAAASGTDNGDNGDVETVTETAPNLVEGNINTGTHARVAASADEADPPRDSLSKKDGGGSIAPLDPVAVKQAFKAKFGTDAYRSHFAKVRLQGRTAIFPSVHLAKRFGRFHAFMKHQGVRAMAAEDDPRWHLELLVSRVAQPSTALPDREHDCGGSSPAKTDTGQLSASL